MFNYGNLAKINLSELRCICNKKLEDQGAICAACGMVLIIIIIGFLFRRMSSSLGKSGILHFS
jgi:hypothetical protein